MAVDPGASGGLAWQHDGGTGCMAMPETNGDLLKALRDLAGHVDTCYIEYVVGFIPGGGAGAMFSFGENFGYLQGCLDALGFRVIRVRPAAWQKFLQLGGKIGKIKADKDCSKEQKKAVSAHNAAIDREWKRKLLGEAQRRFPSLHITLKTADACLLLDYARQQP